MNRKAKKPVPVLDEDSVLVKAFQAGKKAAFDDLVIRHKDRLFNLCYWFRKRKIGPLNWPFC